MSWSTRQSAAWTNPISLSTFENSAQISAMYKAHRSGLSLPIILNLHRIPDRDSRCRLGQVSWHQSFNRSLQILHRSFHDTIEIMTSSIDRFFPAESEYAATPSVRSICHGSVASFDKNVTIFAFTRTHICVLIATELQKISSKQAKNQCSRKVSIRYHHIRENELDESNLIAYKHGRKAQLSTSSSYSFLKSSRMFFGCSKFTNGIMFDNMRLLHTRSYLSKEARVGMQ